MRHQKSEVKTLGPWSLATSRAFWEGFTPAAMSTHNDAAHEDRRQRLASTFLVDADWSRAEATVTQQDGEACVVVAGDGDLDAADAQVRRFVSLDLDARPWTDVADRDPVLADAQAQLPGLRPCGFHSPYEAAVWAVLSQRVRILEAARVRDDLVRRYGETGAFPTPQALRALDLDLPGRKSEYLDAVAEAALEGRLSGTVLRSVEPGHAIDAVQQVKGLGPFAASSS